MSGLEFFLDGGATFASLLSAGAAFVGYQQQKEDNLELVENEEELEQLRQNLSAATTSTCAAHAAVTAAWGQPLSLFRQSGNGWVLEVLQKAKDLVEQAAEWEDLADVYDAQLQLAQKHHRSLLRRPLLALEIQLEELSLALTAQIPAVVLAKEAFQSAQSDSADAPLHATAAIEAARSFQARAVVLFQICMLVVSSFFCWYSEMFADFSCGSTLVVL